MAAVTHLRFNGTGWQQKELKFVTFHVGETVYGASVTDVAGIYHGLPVIPVADLPPCLDGEVTVSGRRVPVLNWRRFVGLAEAPGNDFSWLVLISHGADTVGIAVDHVTEVVTLPPQAMETSADASLAPGAEYIEAVASYRGASMYLPNFGRLLENALGQRT